MKHVRSRGSSATDALIACIGCVLPACTLNADIGGWAASDAAAPDASAPDASALDASAADAAGAPDAAPDCSEAPAPATCAPRYGATAPADLTVALGPGTTYFANGAALPAGEYTLAYVDGCWRSSVVSWTVNLGAEGYALVGGVPEARIVMAPGTTGMFVSLGAYLSYQECVQANQGGAPVAFHFEGGPLAMNLSYSGPIMLFMFLEDGASEGGRAPTFRLSCIAGPCRTGSE